MTTLANKYLTLSTTISDRTAGPDGGCLRDRLRALSCSLEYSSDTLADDMSECLAYANCSAHPAALRQALVDDLRDVITQQDWVVIRDRFRFTDWVSILPPVSLPRLCI